MNLQAKKSLGQHFLTSKKALDEIIFAGNIQKDEIILEIGPGTGILTQGLLDAGAKVIAIEKDNRAIALLDQKFSNYINNGQLKLIEDDILISDSHIPDSAFKVIANIPYYITGAILEKFLEGQKRPTKMVLLVQKEVADRIITKYNKESILSISVKAFGRPKIVSKVPRNAFSPAPTVDSAILSIEDINGEQFKRSNIQISTFFQMIKSAFAHKRKFAIKNLEDFISNKEKLASIWQKLNLNPKIRAEEIAVETWFLIAKEIQ